MNLTELQKESRMRHRKAYSPKPIARAKIETEKAKLSGVDFYKLPTDKTIKELEVEKFDREMSAKICGGLSKQEEQAHRIIFNATLSSKAEAMRKFIARKEREAVK